MVLVLLLSVERLYFGCILVVANGPVMAAATGVAFSADIALVISDYDHSVKLNYH